MLGVGKVLPRPNPLAYIQPLFRGPQRTPNHRPHHTPPNRPSRATEERTSFRERMDTTRRTARTGRGSGWAAAAPPQRRGSCGPVVGARSRHLPIALTTHPSDPT